MASLVVAAAPAGHHSRRSRGRGIRLAARAVAATILLTTLALPATLAQDGGTGAFRPACELISAEQVGGIVGTEVSAQGVGSELCSWSQGDLNVLVSLTEASSLPAMRLVFPDPADIQVAGRAGMSSPGGEGIPATVAVSLDGGGVLLVQVIPAGGTPADPVAAATAIAEAIFAGGPVLARPPAETGGTALGYEGDICDLVTLAEMKEATGKGKFKLAQADTPETCSYSSGDFSMLALVGFIEAELFQFQGSDAVEITIGGLPALWAPQLSSLIVDIGGGRLLQVGMVLFEGKPKQVRQAAEAIATVAVGRLVPVEAPASGTPAGSAAPAGPGCDLLPVEQVASITGKPFTNASDEGISGVGCAYTTADEPYVIVVSRVEAPDPGSAVLAFTEGLQNIPAPEPSEVQGHPAVRGASSSVALVVTDLDGLPEGDDHVLFAGWLFPPADVDAASLLVQLTEAALANL